MLDFDGELLLLHLLLQHGAALFDHVGGVVEVLVLKDDILAAELSRLVVVGASVVAIVQFVVGILEFLIRFRARIVGWSVVGVGVEEEREQEGSGGQHKRELEWIGELRGGWFRPSAFDSCSSADRNFGRAERIGSSGTSVCAGAGRSGGVSAAQRGWRGRVKRRTAGVLGDP